MPTVGWIREADLDAFYEITEYIPDPSPTRETTYACPFCNSIFSVQSNLHDHVYQRHRVERPLIILKGVEPPAHAIVRVPIDPADIALANASFARLSIDGTGSRQVALAALSETLAEIRQAEIKLELINDTQQNAAPVISCYTMSFRVADHEQLKHVEEVFTETLVSSAISRDAIGRFLSNESSQGAGREYASGLADYCLGILIKERPEGENLTTPYSRYRELFGQALEILKEFQRPLAHLITDIIRFSMNDFETGRKKTGYWELDLATILLSNPSSLSLPTNRETVDRRPVCPVDHGTGWLLELTSHLLTQPRWSPILDDDCRALAHSDVLDASDHQKAFAIWAAFAWRLGAKHAAHQPLMQIAGVYPFSQWAGEYLENVST